MTIVTGFYFVQTQWNWCRLAHAKHTHRQWTNALPGKSNKVKQWNHPIEAFEWEKMLLWFMIFFSSFFLFSVSPFYLLYVIQVHNIHFEALRGNKHGKKSTYPFHNPLQCYIHIIFIFCNKHRPTSICLATINWGIFVFCEYIWSIEKCYGIE